MATKSQTFNVWIGNVSLSGRKTCPSCHGKLVGGNSIVSVGEYISGKYRSAFYACQDCLGDTLTGRLYSSEGVTLCMRSGDRRPAWLQLGPLGTTKES